MLATELRSRTRRRRGVGDRLARAWSLQALRGRARRRVCGCRSALTEQALQVLLLNKVQQVLLLRRQAAQSGSGRRGRAGAQLHGRRQARARPPDRRTELPVGAALLRRGGPLCRAGRLALAQRRGVLLEQQDLAEAERLFRG